MNQEIEKDIKDIISKLSEIDDIHKVCKKCGEVGHKVDMVQFKGTVQVGTESFMFPHYYHKDCFKDSNDK